MRNLWINVFAVFFPAAYIKSLRVIISKTCCICVFQMRSVGINTSNVMWWCRRVSACTITIRWCVARRARVWHRGALDAHDTD